MGRHGLDCRRQRGGTAEPVQRGKRGRREGGRGGFCSPVGWGTEDALVVVGIGRAAQNAFERALRRLPEDCNR